MGCGGAKQKRSRNVLVQQAGRGKPCQGRAGLVGVVAEERFVLCSACRDLEGNSSEVRGCGELACPVDCSMEDSINRAVQRRAWSRRSEQDKGLDGLDKLHSVLQGESVQNSQLLGCHTVTKCHLVALSTLSIPGAPPGILVDPANGGKACGETSLVVNCSWALRGAGTTGRPSLERRGHPLVAWHLAPCRGNACVDCQVSDWSAGAPGDLSDFATK